MSIMRRDKVALTKISDSTVIETLTGAWVEPTTAGRIAGSTPHSMKYNDNFSTPQHDNIRMISSSYSGVSTIYYQNGSKDHFYPDEEVYKLPSV